MIRILYILFFAVVIWTTAALNPTRTLKITHQFTSRKPENLTTFKISSIFHPRNSTTIPQQNRNFNNSVLLSEVSSVTSVIPSCSRPCSALKQPKESGRFSPFYKVGFYIKLQGLNN